MTAVSAPKRLREQPYSFCTTPNIRVRRCSFRGDLISGTEAGDQRILGASEPLLSKHCRTKPKRNTRNVSRVLAPRYVRRMQTRDWQTTPGSVHDCDRPGWQKRLGFRGKVVSACSSIHLGAQIHPNQNDALFLLPQSHVVTHRQEADRRERLLNRQDGWQRLSPRLGWCRMMQQQQLP